MAILYLDTYHECRCDCGQIFFVRARRYFTSPQRPPEAVSAICPACAKRGKLLDRDKVKKRNMPPPRRPEPYPVRILFEDFPEMERAIQVSRQRAQFHFNQWASLRGLVLSVLSQWEKQWSRTIMPQQFQALMLCLREQHKELLNTYPVDEKDITP